MWALLCYGNRKTPNIRVWKQLKFIACWWQRAIDLYSVQDPGCQRSHYQEYCLAPWQGEGDHNTNRALDLKVSYQKWCASLDKASHMAIQPHGQGSAMTPYAEEKHKYLINSMMTTPGFWLTEHLYDIFLSSYSDIKIIFHIWLLKCNAKVLGFDKL